MTLVVAHADEKEQKNSNSSDSVYEGKFDAEFERSTVRVLLEHGADVTTRDNTHSTPLHVASSKGNGEAVWLLIRHGAEVNAQDGRRRTPLHRAASSRLAFKRKVVRLLLNSGADVNAEDDKGRTPFQIASSRGLSEIAKLLHQENNQVSLSALSCAREDEKANQKDQHSSGPKARVRL